jgi:heme A synthase
MNRERDTGRLGFEGANREPCEMRQVNPGLHRSALFLAVLAFLVVVSGAYITSIEVAARLSQPDVAPVLNQNLHRALAIALTLLTLGLAIWTGFTVTPGWVRAMAWSGVAVLISGAALGWQSPPLSKAMGVFHALLAHLFLTLIVVITVGTSAGWNREPELAEGPRRPLLRPAAVATPPVVFLQIMLGAAYRHDITSVLPHMAVAMGVAFLALIVSSVVLQNFPRPPALRHAAATLIAIVLAQVCLGITAFLLPLLNFTGTPYFILATIAHVTIGAATLAASVVMAMHVWRSIPPSGA